MKLEVGIYGDTPESNKEKPVRLALQQIDDAVALVVLDKENEVETVLLTFYKNGYIHRWGDINPSYGFKLDADTRLAL